MAQLTSKQKKEWAKVLYVKENLTQREIADKVGSTRQSVNRWISEGKWEELKVGMTLTKEEQIKNLYRQVAELNKAILEREEGARFASASEADTIGKLSAAIRKMESDTGIADIISVGIKFLEWLRKADVEKTKEFVEYWDLFIKDQM